MPCYSTIATKLIDLSMIQKAASDIGAKIVSSSPNTIVIEKDGKRIMLDRPREGANFNLRQGQSSWDYETILEPLTVAYAKATMKAWAQKNGYQFAAGKKQGEYVLVQYAGK